MNKTISEILKKHFELYSKETIAQAIKEIDEYYLNLALKCIGEDDVAIYSSDKGIVNIKNKLRAEQRKLIKQELGGK